MGKCYDDDWDEENPSNWDDDTDGGDSIPYMEEDPAISKADLDVIKERRKQRVKWSTDHDDNEYRDGDLSHVACCLADNIYGEDCFPWVLDIARRHDKRQRLVIAAAFIIAEIDRMDRLTS